MSPFGYDDYAVGTPVHTRDGKCGVLSRLIIKPVERALTHLVVAPSYRRFGHLVPVHMVEASGATIELNCTFAEFESLDDFEEVRWMANGRGFPTYAQAIHAVHRAQPAQIGGRMTVPKRIIHHVPADQIEVSEGVRVYATDGRIGHFHGFVVDPFGQLVTNLVLAEGRLWRAAAVVVPSSAVSRIGNDGVRLHLSKAEVRDLAMRARATRPSVFAPSTHANARGLG